MKKYLYGYRNKTKKIIGITLGVIGLLIVINVMSTKFLLLLVGLGLLLMGILLYMK